MTSTRILYHWTKEVAKHFISLSKPQASVLALFSFGLARAGCCTLNRVAQALPWVGKVDTVERRLQRFLVWAARLMSEFGGSFRHDQSGACTGTVGNSVI